MVRPSSQDDKQFLFERVWPIHPLLTRVLILAAALGAAYWPCLEGQFLWDDIMFISDNELVKQSGGLFKIWFSTESTDYWPVSYTLFWLLWQFFGAWTLPYHLVNLCIHLATTILVERILRRLEIPGALAAAALFALHPVNAESVAWIFQIKTTLSACFALIATLLWLEKRTGLGAASFGLGLLAKTSIVTWPFVLLEASWWRRGLAKRETWLRAAPYFCLALITGLVSLSWYRYGDLVGSERVRTDHGLETWLIAARAFWFYVGTALWPRNLSFIYPRWTLDTADWFDYLPLGALALVSIGGAALALRGRTRAPLALLAYLILTLLPVLGVADVYFFRFSFVADHYQYLALVGPMAVVGYALSRLPKRLARGLTALLVVGLGLLTHARAGIYRDEASVWRDTLARNPGAWLALYNSGNIAYARGQIDVARDFYLRAVKIKPDYVDAIVGLGAAHLALGDEAKARAAFEGALRLFPGHARALNNLATIALAHGDAPGAARYLEMATERLPDYALGFKNLGLVYMRLGDRVRARAALRRAAELRPDDVQVKADLERLQLEP